MSNPFEENDPFLLAMGIGGGVNDTHRPQVERAQQNPNTPAPQNFSA